MTIGPTRYRLSKSKIAAFEHCPRRLWLQIHRRNAGRFDADTLARFEIGHAIGNHAHTFVPNGIMVEADPDMQAALDRTAQLINAVPARPIFEATFQYQDVLVRVDILEPDGCGGWHVIEVKASSRVKAYQLADLATQIWVLRGCGVRVTRGVIRHLAGSLNWRDPNVAAVRFRDADVSAPIMRYVARRDAVAAAARATVRAAEVGRDVGPHCQRPFACEFQAHCRDAQALPLLHAL